LSGGAIEWHGKTKKKKNPSPSDACQQSDAVAQGSLGWAFVSPGPS